VKLAPVDFSGRVPFLVLEDGFSSEAGLFLQDQEEIRFLWVCGGGSRWRTVMERGPAGARREWHSVDRGWAFESGEDLGGIIRRASEG